jgi:uncharacterized protein YqgV (UPF0045/DUF77 family)
MYPLQKSFGNTILEFIHRLKQYPDIRIKTNNLSTQLSGPFEKVMSIITREIKPTFEKEENVVLVMKIYNGPLDLDWIDI